jgi:hypothetical protein
LPAADGSADRTVITILERVVENSLEAEITSTKEPVMRLRTLVGIGVLGVSLVVCGGIEPVHADQPAGRSSPVKPDRRWVFTIRTTKGYVKTVVVYATSLRRATDKLRENHPYARILAVN